MQTILNLPCRVLQFAAAMFPLVAFAASARADIYQWEYINPADPGQGKQQSTTLAPDGAGVDAVPGVDLSYLNLTMAYLRTSDLSGANLTGADLHNADLSSVIFFAFGDLYVFPTNLVSAKLSHANLANANLTYATLTNAEFIQARIQGADLSNTTNSGFTEAQLYSTASYQAKELAGMAFEFNDLTGWNFAGQDLSNVDFAYATLTSTDFTGAEVRGAGFHAAIYNGLSATQLYSTASYRAHDLEGIVFGVFSDLTGWDLSEQNLAYADFARATLTSASFRQANLANANFRGGFVCDDFEGECVGPFYATLNDADLTAADTRGAVGLQYSGISDATTENLIWPDGHLAGVDLEDSGILVVRDHDGNPAHVDSLYGTPAPLPPIPIKVDQHLVMGPGGTLRMVFEGDAWDSTISFAPGIPVALGGSLELTFADDVNPATQRGRTFDLFDWTGVTPTGAFAISSPYAWNLSNLYTTGQVTLTAIPEPSPFPLAAGGLLGLSVFARRRQLKSK